MYIELVDALRCPRPHESTWLVLGADRLEGRDVVSGVLGCPVCGARYPIADGIADLRWREGAGAPRTPPGHPQPDAALAVRLAALLDLQDAAGFAVLVGGWTAQAIGIRAIVEPHLLLVNPPAGVRPGPDMSAILVDGPLPLAAGSARALAVDAAAGTAALADGVLAVRAGGRVVAPVEMPVPDGLTELARDDSVWVAERMATPSAPVPLTHAGR